MNIRELSAFLYLRKPFIQAHDICQVLLALRKFMKEASRKDQITILEAICGYQGIVKELRKKKASNHPSE